MRLVSLIESDRADKKWAATFEFPDGRSKLVHFGASGYDDYTQHGDGERRNRYRERHKNKENWGKADSPGALSRFILWGDSTDIRRNIAEFRRRFDV